MCSRFAVYHPAAQGSIANARGHCCTGKIHVEIALMIFGQLILHHRGGSMPPPTQFASGTGILEQGMSPIGPYPVSYSSVNSRSSRKFSVTGQNRDIEPSIASSSQPFQVTPHPKTLRQDLFRFLSKTYSTPVSLIFERKLQVCVETQRNIS